MSLDIRSMWNFRDPEASEATFRAAMEGASDDDRFILQTQIARTYGLRNDFAKAKEELKSLEFGLAKTSPEGQVRHALEWGRAHCSPAHPEDAITDADRQTARDANLRAAEIAKAAGLDALEIDALHMMTMVDSAPEDQILWNERALAAMERSDQPDAKRWEGSLRNNLGYAYRLAGRYDESLIELDKCRAFHAGNGNVYGERVARWMTARTLRDMGRYQEALDIQHALEKEFEADGETDTYVFEELAALYRATGDEDKAKVYDEKQKS
ncbi:MAG: tetratricopeptide repeat protein [Armatimonadetes bacterium]|nr:tetratricopeptide repeat protein [Armatimonadota bacterium]